MDGHFEPQLVAKVESVVLSEDFVEIFQLVRAFLDRTCGGLREGPVGN